MQYLRPTYQESFSRLKVVCSNWHHLVGTYNNGVWSIYVDGVLESSYTSVSPGTFAGFSHPIYIGRSASGSNAVGRMKEVSLWNYAKPPSQIQAEFKTKYTGNETGLEGYWKLDVSGSTALDLSPNNRTMTAYSVIWNTHNDFTRTFTADKKSHSDYYPFGMQMPGRTGTPSEYSYGFQGMEHLDGANGFGNEYTTEYRQYDPRLGRWTSVDPLAHEFPGMSPYVAFNNNPILYTDPDGQAAINWCNVGYAIKQGASFVGNNAGAFMAIQAKEMGMMGNGGVDFGTLSTEDLSSNSSTGNFPWPWRRKARKTGDISGVGWVGRLFGLKMKGKRLKNNRRWNETDPSFNAKMKDIGVIVLKSKVVKRRKTVYLDTHNDDGDNRKKVSELNTSDGDYEIVFDTRVAPDKISIYDDSDNPLFSWEGSGKVYFKVPKNVKSIKIYITLGPDKNTVFDLTAVKTYKLKKIKEIEYLGGKRIRTDKSEEEVDIDTPLGKREKIKEDSDEEE